MIPLTINETIQKVISYRHKIKYDFFEIPKFRIGSESVRIDAVFKLLRSRKHSIKIEQYDWHSGVIYLENEKANK